MLAHYSLTIVGGRWHEDSVRVYAGRWTLQPADRDRRPPGRAWPRRAVVRRTGVRRQARPPRYALVPLPAGHRDHGEQPQRTVSRTGHAQGPQADLVRARHVL